jgi:hypothetical protein
VIQNKAVECEDRTEAKEMIVGEEERGEGRGKEEGV